ncbi:MAG TPA: DNA mismatch repair protein MutL, partial [Rheinheimera sp.]|nr:DNA mismatch repair protein MutL [Rheinheimera sp.]
NQYGDVKIWGWIVHPSACSSQLQCQYSYVNGRMMRDKLLNHAIRQAYGDSLPAEVQPAFVLYLELDPRQVDVNVHPAKHEVRFHQARLIHDFVVSALSDALAQLSPLHAAEIAPSAALQVQEPRAASYVQGAPTVSATLHRAGNYQSYSPRAQTTSASVATELSYWQQRQVESNSVKLPAGAETANVQPAPGYVLTHNRYLIVQHASKLLLVDLVSTMTAYFVKFPPQAQPLLLPQRLDITRSQLQQLTDHASQFSAAGFDMVITDMTLIVRAVPAFLRQTVLSQWLPVWLSDKLPDGAMNPMHSMLTMLLNANSFGAETMLSFYPDVMTMPELWVSAPLQLEATLNTLQGAMREHGG